MKTLEDVANLEKLVGQLQGLHSEVSVLAKKSPNDGLNQFKLKLVNRVLIAGNLILGDDYRPFDEFESFDVDDVPSNSDVTLIIAQYMEQAERYRSDNIMYQSGTWRYVVDGKPSEIKSKPPSKLGGRN